jgi:hypothetical protein
MDIRRALSLAGVVISCTASVAGAAGDDEWPRLLLHIKNHAGVPGDDLARARAEVVQIFHHSDVTVAWVGEDEPGRIDILLLSITRDSQENSAGCALGLAVASRSTAYVFINRIIMRTRGGAADRPVLIGRVIAHEIGHILMPQRPHPSFGIMRAAIDVGYTNPNRFSGEEGQSIRTRLRARSPR